MQHANEEVLLLEDTLSTHTDLTDTEPAIYEVRKQFMREMSSLSSEGEGQNRPVLKRYTSSLEKEVPATQTKETGALIKEEIAETGNVSRVDMGWGRGLGPRGS